MCVGHLFRGLRRFVLEVLIDVTVRLTVLIIDWFGPTQHLPDTSYSKIQQGRQSC